MTELSRRAATPPYPGELRRADTSARPCACGCDRPVVDRAPGAIYATDACKSRAYKQRRAAAALAARHVPQTLVSDRLRRLRPGARRVYRALELAPGQKATTRDLCQPQVGTHRFGSYLKELRDALAPLHIRITKTRLSNGQCLYHLCFPSADADVPAATAARALSSARSRLPSGGGDVDTARRAA